MKENLHTERTRHSYNTRWPFRAYPPDLNPMWQKPSGNFSAEPVWSSSLYVCLLSSNLSPLFGLHIILPSHDEQSIRKKKTSGNIISHVVYHMDYCTFVVIFSMFWIFVIIIVVLATFISVISFGMYNVFHSFVTCPEFSNIMFHPSPLKKIKIKKNVEKAANFWFMCCMKHSWTKQEFEKQVGGGSNRFSLGAQQTILGHFQNVLRDYTHFKWILHLPRLLTGPAIVSYNIPVSLRAYLTSWQTK